MAERYQHAALVVRGVGPPTGSSAVVGQGLELEGRDVVLTALHRRGDRLELRIVAMTAGATEAVIRGPFDAAWDADLLGRPMGALAVEPGLLRVALGPWEIRTIQLQGTGESLVGERRPEGRMR